MRASANRDETAAAHLRARRFQRLGSVYALLLAVACSNQTVSDDPADHPVDGSIEYEVIASGLRWIVPSSGLPDEVGIDFSNNNLDIVFHDERLYLAWRTAEHHWASERARLHVVSSEDGGQSWRFEGSIRIGRDLREPRLLSIGGRLFLYYFSAGTIPVSFEPQFVYRTERLGEGDWTEPERVEGLDRHVIWDLKVRGGLAYLTSYRTNPGDERFAADVFFWRSSDGVSWAPVSELRRTPYRGGVAEVAFEFDEDGSLWLVTRNDLGDESGFGSHVCYAPPHDLADWRCPSRSDPYKYDSPEMFRHGDDIYLVARRDPEGPYDLGLDLPREEALGRNQLAYWARPKRTAIYRIDKLARKVVFLFDLPSAGDTAFASVRRTGTHEFLLANYTSPLDQPDISWARGQSGPRGTQIYFMDLKLGPARP